MPKHFILHAASLDQTFVHCRIFSSAATRRCMDRHSVFSDHSEYQTIPSPKIIRIFWGQHVSYRFSLYCVAITPPLFLRRVVTGLNTSRLTFPPVREFKFLIFRTSIKILTYSFSVTELRVFTVAFL